MRFAYGLLLESPLIYVRHVRHPLCRHKWKSAVLFYERNGHYNVGGLHTCHLLMQSMVDMYRKHNFIYESFATDSAVGSMTEHLRRVVGLEHSSKYGIM